MSDQTTSVENQQQLDFNYSQEQEQKYLAELELLQQNLLDVNQLSPQLSNNSFIEKELLNNISVQQNQYDSNRQIVDCQDNYDDKQEGLGNNFDDILQKIEMKKHQLRSQQKDTPNEFDFSSSSQKMNQNNHHDINQFQLIQENGGQKYQNYEINSLPANNQGIQVFQLAQDIEIKMNEIDKDQNNISNHSDYLNQDLDDVQDFIQESHDHQDQQSIKVSLVDQNYLFDNEWRDLVNDAKQQLYDPFQALYSNFIPFYTLCYKAFQRINNYENEDGIQT
eukprot:403339862